MTPAGSNWADQADVTPVLLALIAAVQSIVATLAMAYVKIRTHPAGTVTAEDPSNGNAGA